MDPRLLLDRKAMKKQMANGGKTPKASSSTPPVSNKRSPQSPTSQGSDRIDTVPSSQQSSAKHDTSPASARFYDPRALLNPRGSSNHPSRSTTDPNHATYPGSGSLPYAQMTSSQLPIGQPPKNLLTAYHGVEERTESPRKKIKVSDTSTEEDKPVLNGHTNQHRSNGAVGDFFKAGLTDQIRPQDISNNVVDLTNDDVAEDSDIKFTGSRNVNDTEVCLGGLNAWAQMHLIPKPRGKSNFETPQRWPLLNCTLRRLPADQKNTKISLVDYHGKDFGRLDYSTAVPLAQVIDVLPGLRTQARILPRDKVGANPWPHQPTSERTAVKINVYAMRSDVDRIGKLFGQHNIWFVPPLSSDRNIPLVNPHADKKVVARVGSQSMKPRGNILTDTRTAEEVSTEVSKLFDEAEKSAALTETDAPPSIITQLLAHQKQALTFMLNHERPRTYGDLPDENSSLWRKRLLEKGRVFYEDPVSGYRIDQEPPQVLGGLLADVMGLGKTLETLSLVASTTDDAKSFGTSKHIRTGEEERDLTCNSRATLIVCPTSTVQNWENQIKEHMDPQSLTYCVYHGPNRERNAFQLAKFDIVITTYGTVASDHTRKSGNNAPLTQIKWFRIVLDEAHTIREQRTNQSEAINKLWAQRRWCLTGTPIQNRIDDLGALTHFLRLYPYDSPHGFNQFIRGPALAGDPAFLYKLRLFVDSFTLRRLRDKVDLPKRNDLIQDLEFSKVEQNMHDVFRKRAYIEVEKLAQSKEKKSGMQHHVLQAIMTLRLICAHGRDLLKEKDLTVLKGITQDEPIDLDDEEEPNRTIDKRTAYETLKLKTDAEVDFCQQCDKRLCGDTPSAEIDDEVSGARCYVLPCLDTVCADCFEPVKSSFWENAEGQEPVACPFCGLVIAAQYVGIKGPVTETLESMPDEVLQQKVKEDEDEQDTYSGPSTKTKALLKDIEFMKEDSKPFVAQGEPPIKCVVFSEFTSNLSLIERDLAARGHTFVRIDGSMSLNKRKQVLEALATDDSVTILLASIKAAGQGLNLTAASRAFIMEPMWNPAAEAQAVDRIYRIGQKREVFIKRYLIKNSIEGKIVELQQKKQQLADVTMTRNHKQLSKKEVREQHMKDIVKLFK